jgi:hypothetical protein
MAPGLCAPVAVAIPVQVSEPGYSLTLPEGFREIVNSSHTSDVSRLFVMASSDEQGGTETWLTISRVRTNDPLSLYADEDTNGMKVVGRYSERINDLDLEVLVSQVRTNDAVAIEQSVRLPLDPHLIQLDLTLHSDDDEKARETMRKIIQSVTRTAPTTPPAESAGWGGTAICLVGVAIAFVVLLARR